MSALIRRARRRLFYQALLAQGANTASAALLAFIVLLLLGAEVLDWRWLVLIPVAAAAAGIWLARRRLASHYVTAQLIDRRMGLADSLSTALFFDGPGAPRADAEMRRLQAEAAERIAAAVDLRRAIPFTVPRTAYAMGVLVLVASSLFALRYAVSRRLDLRPPLAMLLEQSLGEKPEMARNLPRYDAENILPGDRDPDAAVDQEAKAEGDQESDLDRTDTSAEQKRAAGESNKQTAKEQGQQGGQQDGDQNGQQSNQASDQAGNPSDSGKQGNQAGKQGNPRQDGGNNSGSQNSSLVSKLKDALQNLLSHMNQRDGQSGEPQSGDQKNQQAKGNQKGGRQQSARNGQSKSGQQQSDSQSEANSQQAQDAQQAGDKGAATSDARQSSNQPGSGVGSQNGDKDVKQAEQLAAMGKISEIVGKRQQNISGETTVEVQSSTTQVLHTPYARRAAEHSESNADLNRDEIPAALQAYVEQYFEQVRKPAKK